MNTTWMFFDIESSPTWQLIKHIKRIFQSNKQTNSEELEQWRLPPPPLIKRDAGTRGRGDAVTEREDKGTFSSISNPQSPIEFLDSYPGRDAGTRGRGDAVTEREDKGTFSSISNPQSPIEFLDSYPGRDAGTRGRGDAVTDREDKGTFSSISNPQSPIEFLDSYPGRDAERRGRGDAGTEREERETGEKDKEDKGEKDKEVKNIQTLPEEQCIQNTQEMLVNSSQSSSSSLSPSQLSQTDVDQLNMEITEDITMQELKQSQQEPNNKSQFVQLPSHHQGNGSSKKSKTELAVDINQQLKSDRQWLFNLASKMREVDESQSLCKLTVTELHEHLQVDRALIYRFQAHNLGVVVAESMTTGYTPSQGELLQVNAFGAEHQHDYKEKPVIVLNDISQTVLTPHQLQLLERFQVQASLSLPIWLGEELWGLLVVQQCSRSRQWQEAEIAFAQQIAHQFSLNFQKLKYTEQLRSQSEQIARTAEGERIAATVFDKLRNTAGTSNFFQSVTQVIRQQLKCDRVAVYRFHPDWSGEYIVESMSQTWVPLVGATIESDYLQETQGGRYRHHETLAVNDINQDVCEGLAEFLAKFETKAFISVPIFQGEKLWGLLSAYQNSKPRHWDIAEVGMLAQIGRQFLTTLQQAEYLEQVTQAAESERLAFRIIQKIRKTSDTASVFQTVTQEVRQRLKCDRVAVYRFGDDWSGTFVAESMASDWVRLVDSASPTIWEDTYLQENQGGQYRENESLVVDDIYQAGFSDCYLELLEQFQAKAYIIVPIFQGEKLWGLFAAYQNSGSRHWEATEINFLTRISRQFGIALQQVDYIEQLQLKSKLINSTVTAERTADRIIDKIRNNLQDLDNVFRLTAEGVRQHLKCDRVAVYRFDDNWSGKFVAEAVGKGWVTLVGPNIETVWEDTYLQENQGGRYRNNETFAVDDIYQAGHFPCHIDILEQFQIRAYIIVPIFRGQKLWGLFSAYQNSGPRHWEEPEVAMLNRISQQLGIAILQTEYIDQLRTKSDQLAKAVDLKKAAVNLINSRQSLNRKTIFQTTVIEVRQILKADRVAVFRFYPDSGFDDGEMVAEDVVAGYKPILDIKIHDHCFGEQYAPYYAQGRAQAVADIYNGGLSDCHIKVLSMLQVRANLIVPLLKNMELWGLLCIHQCSGPRQWEDAEIEFARQIAGQLGVALQQTDYVEQLEAKTTQITKTVTRERAAVRAIEKIRKTSDIDTIFRTATQEVRKLLNVERVTIYKFRDDYFGDFIVESESGDWPTLVGSGWEDSYLNEHQGGRFRDNEPFVVDDVYNGDLTDCHVEALEYFGVKSCMVVSIFQGSNLWGLLSAFQHSSSRHWEEGEVTILSQVGTQLGVALQQAEYLKQLQEQSNQMTKTAQREKGVAQVIARLLRSQDITITLRTTIQEVRYLLQCDRTAV
ncbi:MAG: GAF domain-containing protein, partial [Symploca sp. SIO2G7]|nr:GAF domain-containing protein [Symploca sp. SIO2G7]